MMFSQAARQVLTVLRAAASTSDDAYGNPIPGVTATIRIPGCMLQPVLGPGASVEAMASDFDQLVNMWRFFAPVGADIRATDRVDMGGVLYEVDGQPQTWPGFAGRPHHVEGYLRRWEG